MSSPNAQARSAENQNSQSVQLHDCTQAFALPGCTDPEIRPISFFSRCTNLQFTGVTVSMEKLRERMPPGYPLHGVACTMAVLCILMPDCTLIVRLVSYFLLMHHRGIPHNRPSCEMCVSIEWHAQNFALYSRQVVGASSYGIFDT